MTSHRIGYGRVSTLDQNPESQEDALKAAGCSRVHVDHYSGTKASRPQWDRARDVLRTGDTLVITRLDRLGRSTKDLLSVAEWLRVNGIALVATEQQIDTTTVEGRLFFTMIAAFAEFEHDLMQARTLDGLKAARDRGRVGGRKPKLTAKQLKAIRLRHDAGEGATDLAASFNVSRPTIYRALEATQ
ncbi:recombinase family protein [Clavibacter nebraskensis]|uniref:recombinase family protein n=1 Tax=Clavibacter nebraskensis TaxID=31963 RepID=UPI00200BCCD0|nr:recombinase family protein [Clavibacter nebraskensis]UQB14593.1 recombinase family protein [Clavibacter nebraskensis]UQB17425.1 recombinase family protein [Clavibacter nebraskensis]